MMGFLFSLSVPRSGVWRRGWRHGAPSERATATTTDADVKEASFSKINRIVQKNGVLKPLFSRLFKRYGYLIRSNPSCIQIGWKFIYLEKKTICVISWRDNSLSSEFTENPLCRSQEDKYKLGDAVRGLKRCILLSCTLYTHKNKSLKFSTNQSVHNQYFEE